MSRSRSGKPKAGRIGKVELIFNPDSSRYAFYTADEEAVL